jgi:regulator of sigma E protease
MDYLSSFAGSVWQNGILFLLVLTVVVFIHELGHFLVARWCGVTVKAFSIGFGPEIFGFYDKHGTRWRFAWIPLGGYVKFVDDENAASKPSPEALKRMTPAEREGSFHAKPVSQRAAVVSAGPIANFLLSIALFAAINYFVGVRVTPATIGTVVADSPAARAGFLPGDRVISIDGAEVDSGDDVQSKIEFSGGREMAVVVERNKQNIPLSVTPTVEELRDQFGRSLKHSDIGIRATAPARIGELQKGLPAEQSGLKAGDLITAINDTPVVGFEDIPKLLKVATGPVKVTVDREGKTFSFDVVPVMKPAKDEAGNAITRPMIGVQRATPEAKPVSLVKAFSLGVKETYQTITSSLMGIKAIWSGRQSAEQMGGPLMMAEVTGKVAELGLEPLLRWLAFISANIGFLNLLPIPVLDGGHLLFYAYEAIFRKPLNERFQMAGFQVGLALLAMLMAFVFYNDISSIVRRTLGAG